MLITSTLKPNAQRARMAMILVGIVTIIEVITLVSGWMQHQLLSKAMNGESITMEEANANDLRVQILAILFMVAYIISAITFILWFRRAYFNLHQKTQYLKFSEGWAAGSWFVPFLNLVRPFQIMKELYTHTAELLAEKSDRKSLSNALLGIWWFLWVVYSILGNISFRMSRDLDTLEKMMRYTWVDMIGNMVAIPLGLITLKVIYDYALLEPELSNLDDGAAYVHAEADVL